MVQYGGRRWDVAHHPRMKAFISPLAAFMLVAAAAPAAESLHFKPKDHALGDVHPFFQNGECYLYYLKPGKYESALARSKDWLTWTETAIEHTPVKDGDWMAPYYVLGVMTDPKTFHYRSFYGHKEGRMVSSESSDLIHWSCAPQEYHIPPADYYQRRRDPYVFWIPELKQYGCVMTTRMKGRPNETAGAVSLALSPDLKQWKDHGAILDPGNIGEPECPQMFRLGQRWYLLASIYDRAVGAPVYWTAESPLGPWGKTPTGALDGKDLCAAQIAFDGATPVLFGWAPLTEARPGKQPWGGYLALPREVHVLDDGKLGTRLPAKLVRVLERLAWQPHVDVVLSPKSQPIPGQWQKLAAEFTLQLADLTAEVRLKLPPLGEVVMKAGRLAILDGSGECWSELSVDLPAGKPLSVRLYVDGGIVEVFVADHYSLVARVPSREGAVGLSMEVAVSGAEVTKLRVSEWTGGR